MTEDEARAWMEKRFGADRTASVAAFLDIVIGENDRQNLIAPSTIPTIWNRHAADSAQLVAFAHHGDWLDIGTGGGFPGFVVALLTDIRVTLVEPRRRRAEFLQHCASAFDVADRVTVVCGKVERLEGSFATISARAVASIENLLLAASRCATVETRWLLPRGRIDPAEIDALGKRWRHMFHVEQSVTDQASGIVVLDRVSAR